MNMDSQTVYMFIYLLGLWLLVSLLQVSTSMGQKYSASLQPTLSGLPLSSCNSFMSPRARHSINTLGLAFHAKSQRPINRTVVTNGRHHFSVALFFHLCKTAEMTIISSWLQLGDALEVTKSLFLFLGVQSSRRGGYARAGCVCNEGTSVVDSVPSAPMTRQGLRGDCSHRIQQCCFFFL
jgi:hypothetical protein